MERNQNTKSKRSDRRDSLRESLFLWEVETDSTWSKEKNIKNQYFAIWIIDFFSSQSIMKL